MVVAALALAMAVTAAACGSKEDKKAEQAQQTAEQGAKQAASGLEQVAKGLEALASGTGATGPDGKPVEPVSFRDMQALFPDLDGWEKEKPTGEKITVPFPISQAEVSYTKGNAQITLKTMDSGFNQLFLAPYAIFLQAGYEKETTDGYEKSTTVGGQPGWEKWNSESKDGELNALVGKRFLLTIDGHDIEDVKILHELANKIDMNRFAALK
jgi:hypothetical protein